MRKSIVKTCQSSTSLLLCSPADMARYALTAAVNQAVIHLDVFEGRTFSAGPQGNHPQSVAPGIMGASAFAKLPDKVLIARHQA